jgi:hypothetical protein
VTHGIVDVFAYQEALLLEAAFGVALLVMLWIGFRRWLQHKEKIAQLIAGQAAERAAQEGEHMERIESRLNRMEQIVADGNVQSAARIDSLPTHPLPSAGLGRDEN